MSKQEFIEILAALAVFTGIQTAALIWSLLSKLSDISSSITELKDSMNFRLVAIESGLDQFEDILNKDQYSLEKRQEIVIFVLNVKNPWADQVEELG